MNDSLMGRSRSGAGAALFLAGAVFVFFFFPGKANAGMILDAELRFTYEDNVVGLLSDQPQGRGGTVSPTMMAVKAPAGMGGMGGGGNGRYTGAGSSTQSPGDFSATLSAEAGGYRDLGENAEVFAKGFAESQTYDTYTDLDSVIGGVSTGVNLSLTDMVSARAAVIGKVKRFGDSQRDSTSYGGTFSVKERLTREFWLREFIDYEKNNADNAQFSYTGTTVGAGAGYALFRNTLMTLGYSYLVQAFEDPSGAEMTTNTVYVGAEQTLSKSWSVAGEYDLQVSKSNVTGTTTTDDIFSVALRYSY